MNRSIEQALLSLIPTQNSNLPPALTDLAGSLLAQSRHRASTLKAEEEIARAYACAHLACDRLKTSLNLPEIVPRPPIRPRDYKRLYTHLDKILPHASSASRTKAGRIPTPSSKLRSADPTSSPASRPLPSRGTPSKDTSLALFRTPSKTGTTSTPSSKLHTGTGRRSTGAGILPPWIRPTTRFLCAELGTPQLGPTVMAGMEAIVAPHGRRTTDAWVNGHPAALLAAIYWFVAERARMEHIREAVDAARYKAARKQLLGVFKRAREEVQLKGEGDDVWAGWDEIGAKDLDGAIMEVNQRGWLQSDWYQDVVRTENGEVEDPGDEEGDEPVQGAQVWKSDTMFQKRYDYLSEERRAEYKVWKADIMRRIEELERGTGDAMEVDS